VIDGDQVLAACAISMQEDGTLTGDTVVATFQGRPGGPRALLIGHMDTVFDPGTAAERPYRSEGTRAFGPGVTDMKAGLLAGLHAIGVAREGNPELRGHAVVQRFDQPEIVESALWLRMLRYAAALAADNQPS